MLKPLQQHLNDHMLSASLNDYINIGTHCWKGVLIRLQNFEVVICLHLQLKFTHEL